MTDFANYHSFVFESDSHTYTTEDGLTRPSITQMMSRAKIYDFSMVKPDVLENARRRGTNVHRWCAEIDLYGFVDESWIAADEMGYVGAWVKFKRESGLVVQRVETPMVRTVGGFVIAGTPDVIGMIGRNRFIVERKACSAKHEGWAIQTGMQEMLETGKLRLGHMHRAAVQLKPNGAYSFWIHEDPSDEAAVIATLTLATTQDRFEAGEARLTLNSWLSNHGLPIAA